MQYTIRFFRLYEPQQANYMYTVGYVSCSIMSNRNLVLDPGADKLCASHRSIHDQKCQVCTAPHAASRHENIDTNIQSHKRQDARPCIIATSHVTH